MLDQGNDFYAISPGILITCLLNNVWILERVVTCSSPVEGLMRQGSCNTKTW